MNTSEKVWQEYHPRLRAFVKSRIPDDMTADDVLQNVFLKMHTGLASLKDATKLQSWLYQIARNAIIDYYRSQKPTVEIPESHSAIRDRSRRKSHSRVVGLSATHDTIAAREISGGSHSIRIKRIDAEGSCQSAGYFAFRGQVPGAAGTRPFEKICCPSAAGLSSIIVDGSVVTNERRAWMLVDKIGLRPF